ncbi:MAG: hypothetical protein HY794_13460 [Desulfarculus sp.]|nr:hypothetical protein [Desulfarculus sp.]
MPWISLPAGRWGLSEPDGRLHLLLDDGRECRCGRLAKPVRVARVPDSLPWCPECLGQGLFALRTLTLARVAINALLRRA